MQWLAKKFVKKATGSHDATRNHINHQCHLLIDSDRSADVYHLILGGFDRRDLDSAPIAEAKCACLPPLESLIYDTIGFSAHYRSLASTFCIDVHGQWRV